MQKYFFKCRRTKKRREEKGMLIAICLFSFLAADTHSLFCSVSAVFMKNTSSLCLISLLATNRQQVKHDINTHHCFNFRSDSSWKDMSTGAGEDKNETEEMWWHDSLVTIDSASSFPLCLWFAFDDEIVLLLQKFCLEMENSSKVLLRSLFGWTIEGTWIRQKGLLCSSQVLKISVKSPGLTEERCFCFPPREDREECSNWLQSLVDLK